MSASMLSAPPRVASDADSWLPGRTPAEVAAREHSVRTHHDEATPIPVWRRGADRLVIDDIDRFEYCVAHGVEVTFAEFEFESEDEARLFVLERNRARQLSGALGRRYIDGAIYNLHRRPGARTDRTSPQREGRSAISKFHQRFGRSRASLERDGRLARQIDDAAEVHGRNVRSMLLDPKHRLTVAHIERFAALSLDEQDQVLDTLKHGVIDASIKRPAPTAVSDTPGAEVDQPEGGEPTEGCSGVKLATAVQALLEQVAALQMALEEPAQSGAYASELLERNARQIASRHSALQDKFREAQLRSAMRPLKNQTPPAGDEAARDAPVPKGYLFGNWMRSPEDLSTAVIVEEVRRMLRLAEALEAEGHAGIPLGVHGEFVTVEALRLRSDTLEALLAKRQHQPQHLDGDAVGSQEA